ncbi:MAG: SRPBCC domain-containing protein [Asticcacaulis sp.]
MTPRPNCCGDVWTKAEHLSQWFGPPGTTVKVASLDLTPGGVFLYGMEMPGGITMWGKWVFRESINPAASPMSSASATRNNIKDVLPKAVRGRSMPWPRNAPFFTAGHSSMQMGFSGTFMALEAYLAKLK